MSTTRLLLGLGAVVVAAITLRSRASARAALPTRTPDMLPASLAGDSTTEQELQEVMTPSSSAPDLYDGKTSTILSQIEQSIRSARAQVDAALAEGRATREKTRQTLEQRYAAAKTDPASARNAFL